MDVEESETPDFIVESLDKKISIELTRFITPELKQGEEFRTKIVEMAEQMFLEKYDCNLRVFVTFSEAPIKCKTNEIRRYAYEIVGVVEHVYQANKEFEFKVSSRHSRRPFNWFIDTISINNNMPFSNWQTMGAYKVDRVDFNQIVSIIERKQKNIIRYKQPFDENWLVIVSSLGSKSSTFDFAFVSYDPFNTDFERIFVYEYTQDKVIEIDSKNGWKSPVVFSS